MDNEKKSKANSKKRGKNHLIRRIADNKRSFNYDFMLWFFFVCSKTGWLDFDVINSIDSENNSVKMPLNTFKYCHNRYNQLTFKIELIPVLQVQTLDANCCSSWPTEHCEQITLVEAQGEKKHFFEREIKLTKCIRFWKYYYLCFREHKT